MYDRGAPSLFKNYGGGNWPAVLLPDTFNSVDLFGGFGYGIVVVDEDGIVRSIGEYAVEDTVNKMFLTGAREAKNAEEAAAFGGYWHNGKCWRVYDDSSIDVKEVADIVDRRFELFSDSKVTIEDQQWNVESIQLEDEYPTMSLAVVFNGGENIKLTSHIVGDDKNKRTGLIRGHFKTKTDSSESEITYTSKGLSLIHI